MGDERHTSNSANELAVPFMFVPDGEEPSPAWLANHRGAVRIPARLVPRQSENGTDWAMQFNQADTPALTTDDGQTGDPRQPGPAQQAFGAPPPPDQPPSPQTAADPPVDTPGDGASMAPYRTTPRQPSRSSGPPANT